MVRLLIRQDTVRSDLGRLVPQDIQLNAAALDLMHISAYRSLFGGALQQQYDPVLEAISVERVTYRNPFDIVAVIRGIPVEAVRFVLNRTLFYKQEVDRMEIANEKAREDVISAKLDNIEKALSVRQRMIEGGASVEDATKALGKILSHQKATVRLLGPKPSRSEYD